jgi:hypothetical protein
MALRTRQVRQGWRLTGGSGGSSGSGRPGGPGGSGGAIVTAAGSERERQGKEQKQQGEGSNRTLVISIHIASYLRT